MKNLVSLAVILPAVCYGGIKEKDVIPGLKLRLDTQLQITDNHGVIAPSQIVSAVVGKLIVIYRTDGFKYEGQITEIEESADYLKVYGKFLNVNDAQFGFVLAKGGYFTGAIVEKKDSKTYIVEFSPEHKGFIFIRSYKYDKPSAKNDAEELFSLVEPTV